MAGATMTVVRLFSRQIVGIIIIAYCIGFWRSATQLPDGPAVFYPQLVIVVLVAFVAADFVATVLRALRGQPLQTQADPMKAAEPAPENEGAAPDDRRRVATATRGQSDPRGAALALVTEHHKTVVTLVVSLVYLYLTPRIGFYEATALYLLVLFPYLGLRSWKMLVPVWAGSVLVYWLLFNQVLSVRVPRGPLF
jgi:flagellar biosynthesis protein FliQ